MSEGTLTVFQKMALLLFFRNVIVFVFSFPGTSALSQWDRQEGTETAMPGMGRGIDSKHKKQFTGFYIFEIENFESRRNSL